MKIRIGKYTWKPLVLVKNLIVLATIVMVMWITVSYAEILAKNVNENPQYTKWNFFEVTLN